MKTSEAFPSSFLKAADLKGRSVKVTISQITMEKVGEDRKPTLHFIGTDKMLVLNKTNSNRIEEATGTDEMDNWAGWTITLYSCKVDYQGKRVDAIRVDDRPGATTSRARAEQIFAPKPPAAPQYPAEEEFESAPFGEPVPPPADVNEDDIPFAWLLPLLLPLLLPIGAALMGSGVLA